MSANLSQDTQTVSSIDWYESPLSPHFRQAMIDIGEGITLCVETMGNPKNPPLLFVAGLGSHITFWSYEFLSNFVEQGFFVIRFDNRDVGLSTKIHINGLPKLNTIKMMAKVQFGLSNRSEVVAYNLSDMAEDTARLIKALAGEFGFDKINLVGVSMGGMICQIVSARYPNYVSTLNLIFSSTNAAFLPLPKPKQFATFFRRPESHSQKDVVRHSVWFMTAVGTPGHLDIKGTRSIAEERYNRCFHPLGVVQQVHAILATGSTVRFAKKIKAPTLILHGTKDGLIPLNHGKSLAKHIDGSRLVLIDGMAHDLPVYFHDFIVKEINLHYKKHAT